MKLESDATTIYGIPNFDIRLGGITDQERQVDNPYNTHTRTGLPPGPICNPSVEAIRAALFPAETNHTHFEPDGSGGHKFDTRET